MGGESKKGMMKIKKDANGSLKHGGSSMDVESELIQDVSGGEVYKAC